MRSTKNIARLLGYQNKFYAKHLISPLTTTLSVRKLKMKMYNTEMRKKLRRKVTDFATYFNNYMHNKESSQTKAIPETENKDENKQDITKKHFATKYLSQKKLGKND